MHHKKFNLSIVDLGFWTLVLIITSLLMLITSLEPHFLGFEGVSFGNGEKISISNISTRCLSISNGYTLSLENILHTLTATTTNLISVNKLCTDNDISV